MYMYKKYYIKRNVNIYINLYINYIAVIQRCIYSYNL